MLTLLIPLIQKPFPTVNSNMYLHNAASDILHLLQTLKNALPNLNYVDTTTNAYIQISTNIIRSTDPPTLEKNPLHTKTPIKLQLCYILNNLLITSVLPSYEHRNSTSD